MALEGVSDEFVYNSKDPNRITKTLHKNDYIQLKAWQLKVGTGRFKAWDVWFLSGNKKLWHLDRVFQEEGSQGYGKKLYIITDTDFDYSFLVTGVDETSGRPPTQPNPRASVIDFFLTIGTVQLSDLTPVEECLLTSVENCPINPQTNLPMHECMNWRRTDYVGEKCRNLLTEKDRDKSIANYCSSSANREDCRCVDPAGDPEFERLSDIEKGPVHCWFKPCLSNAYLKFSRRPKCKVVNNVCEISYKVDGQEVRLHGLDNMCTEQKKDTPDLVKNTVNAVNSPEQPETYYRMLIFASIAAGMFLILYYFYNHHRK